MSNLFQRVYRSFEDFERTELRKLDYLYDSVDDMVDELVLSEMDDDNDADEDGILFDSIDSEEDIPEEEEGYY